MSPQAPIAGHIGSLLEIITRMRAAFAAGAQTFELDVLDPDHAHGRYAGERVEIDGVTYVHRPLRVWLDLAERLDLRMRTPRASSLPLLRLVFEPLDDAPDGRDPRHPRDSDPRETYGTASAFARISKLEDPSFVLDVSDALGRIALPRGARILDLGVNTGDELELLLALEPALHDATFVGIDHSPSAIAAARTRFDGRPNITFHVADLADASALATLQLGRFDLVLSIATLQSAGLDDRALLRRMVQDHLSPTGAVVLGMPNCRYVAGETSYGTRMKNFRQPELGLLVKDVAFYRKYLQQHHRKVFVTGKHYILVTAVSIQP